MPPTGAVAQLGERRVRNAKVGSSILLRSTIFINGLAKRLTFSERHVRQPCDNEGHIPRVNTVGGAA